MGTPYKYNSVNNDRTKALLRSLSEATRVVDETRRNAQSLAELCASSALAQRCKLRDIAYAIIFNADEEGSSTCRMAEDILWKKTYHDVISRSRTLKTPGDLWTEEEALLVQPLLFSGINFFKNLLNKLEHNYEINIQNNTDFSLTSIKIGLPKAKHLNKNADPKRHHQWALGLAQRCLIYQGDLHRYLIELKPKGWDCSLSERCYYQALSINNQYGRPFNQLGTLVGEQNFGLDRVYYYMRSVSCTEPFALAEGNLRRLFEKNTENMPITMRPLQRLFSNILMLIQNWYFGGGCLEQVQSICLEVCEGFQQCLKEEACPIVWDMGQNDINKLAPFRKAVNSDKLDCKAVLKIFALIFISIDKLKYQDSSSIALIFTLLDHLATYLNDKFRQLFVKHPRKTQITMTSSKAPDANTDEANNFAPSRRRRRRKLSASSDNDESDDDENGENNDLGSSDEEDEEFEKEGAEEDAVKELECDKLVEGGEGDDEEGMTVRDVSPDWLLSEMTLEGLLQPLVIAFDWLGAHLELVEHCADTSKPLLENILRTINLFCFDDDLYDTDNWKISDERRKFLKEKSDKFPTCEDTLLRGLVGLRQHFDWQLPFKHSLTNNEMSLVRLYRIRGFGHLLVKTKQLAVDYDAKKKFYISEITNGKQETTEVVATVNGDEKSNANDQSQFTNNDNDKKRNNGELMKNMGQLWLKAEVRELESRVRNNKDNNGCWSPYLIVDTDALIQHMHLVKNFVGSKHFIVIIPVVVLGQLDECKRLSGRARETIRWLEWQFQHGNRCLRAQKHQETFSLPLVRYPKRKDKEAWNFFKIMECCHYFSKQTDFSNASNKPKAVTFLIGNEENGSLPGDFSRSGIAKTFGINMEHIVAFHSKWKVSTKSNG